jgi:hypothetical protein
MSKDEEIKINQEKGAKIIDALNRYEQVHGQFPETLHDLTPNFLDEIPKTVDGSDFEYQLYNLSEPYFLSFDVGNRPACSYFLRGNLWDCTRGVDD